MNDADRALLAFEDHWNRRGRHDGAKERNIPGTLGVSVTAYYLRLAQLLDDPDAVAAHPRLVRVLRARVADRHRLLAGGRRDR